MGSPQRTIVEVSALRRRRGELAGAGRPRPPGPRPAWRCLLVAAFGALTAITACGGGGQHRTVAPSVPGPTVAPRVPVACGSAGKPGCSPPLAATITLKDGYTYGVRSLGGVTTATTEQSQGSTQDAPPGKAFLQATLAVQNTSGRQEPLDPFAQANPAQVVASFAIPTGSVSRFGVPYCDSLGVTLPDGYCGLSGQVSSINGPNSDTGGTVEMAPGDTETVVTFASSQVTAGGNLPLADVALFAGDTSPASKVLGTELGTTPGSSGPVNVIMENGSVVTISRGPVSTATSVPQPDPTLPPLKASAGREFLTVSATVKNTTSQPLGIGDLDPSDAGGLGPGSGPLYFVIPLADATAFGASASLCVTTLADGNATIPAPPKTCAIGATAATYTPADQARTQSLAPGASTQILMYGPSYALGQPHGVSTGPLSNVVVYVAGGGSALPTKVPEQP